MLATWALWRTALGLRLVTKRVADSSPDQWEKMWVGEVVEHLYIHLEQGSLSKAANPSLFPGPRSWLPAVPAQVSHSC